MQWLPFDTSPNVEMEFHKSVSNSESAWDEWSSFFHAENAACAGKDVILYTN